MITNLQPQKKWYNNKLILILLFFILPPLGIYGIWKRESTKDLKKVIYTILGALSSLVLLFVIISFFMDSNKMYYENGESELIKENYSEAIKNFQNVQRESSKYQDARNKISQIDSIIYQQKDLLNKERQKLAEVNKLKLEKLSAFQKKWADSVVKSWNGDFIIAVAIPSIDTISFELSKNATNSFNSNVSQALPMYITDYKNATQSKFGNQFETVNTKVIFSPNKDLQLSSKSDEYSNPIFMNTGLKIYAGNKYSKKFLGTLECKIKDETDGMIYFHIVKSDGSTSRIEESNLRLNYFARKDDPANSSHSGVNKCY